MMHANLHNVYLICGPTASGKSALANELASKYNGVIVNADASQVYKEIPICTASPTIAEFNTYKHYLYNHISVISDYSVGTYILEAQKCIESIVDSNKTPILVGGSGLYINALLKGIDLIPDVPHQAKQHVRDLFEEKGIEKFYNMLVELVPDAKIKIGQNDKQRMMRAYEVFYVSGKPLWEFYGNATGINTKYNIEIIKVLPDREKLYAMCDARVHQLIKHGAIDEVQALSQFWDKIKPSPKKAILVNELYQYLTGELSLDEAITLAQKNTRNYAKRQYTWFRNQL